MLKMQLTFAHNYFLQLILTHEKSKTSLPQNANCITFFTVSRIHSPRIW